MNITRENYEPYFLDYLEGNLKEEQIDQFLDFLEQNPDLKQELKPFDNLILPEVKIVFSGKQQLYKRASEEKAVPENTFIAYLEGDMENEERKSFETYLSSYPEIQKEYSQFAKTRLIPDSGITYPDRKKLYRKSGSVILMNWVARAAAVILLVWGLNSLLQTENMPKQPSGNQVITQLNTKQIPPVEKAEKEISKSVLQQTLKASSAKLKYIQEQAKESAGETLATGSNSQERDLTALAKITPIAATLELESVANQLAVSRSKNAEKINDARNIMSIEEFLAARAKKVSNESLLSAQRIVRLGLGVASELSGKRIGYSMKDGKIASVDFESRLMAFSIPLKKN